MNIIRKSLLLPAIVALAALLSCSPTEDHIFDDMPTRRMAKIMTHVDSVLTAPVNGWLMQYYPSSTQAYGGYNVLARFSADGTVTMASETSGADVTATSGYEVTQSSGCVLTFNTYNSVFHAYSTPEESNGGGNGYGYEGDFEFVVMSATADEVVLKGRKTGSVAVMRPITPAITWKAYLSAIKEEANLIGSYYRMQYHLGDSVYEARMSGRHLAVYRRDESQAWQLERNAPFIVTMTGLQFYSPLTMDSVSIDGLVFDPLKGDEGAWVASNNDQAMFYPSYPSFNELIVTSTWYFSCADMSEKARAYWKPAQEAMEADGDRLFNAYLTWTENFYTDDMTFYFNCSKHSYGYLTLDVELIGDNQISFIFGRAGSTVGSYHYSTYHFNSILTMIGNDKKRTFTLTADNPKNPQLMTFVDNDDPDIKFTLHRAPVYYPFNY